LCAGRKDGASAVPDRREVVAHGTLVRAWKQEYDAVYSIWERLFALQQQCIHIQRTVGGLVDLTKDVFCQGATTQRLLPWDLTDEDGHSVSVGLRNGGWHYRRYGSLSTYHPVREVGVFRQIFLDDRTKLMEWVNDKSMRFRHEFRARLQMFCRDTEPLWQVLPHAGRDVWAVPLDEPLGVVLHPCLREGSRGGCGIGYVADNTEDGENPRDELEVSRVNMALRAGYILVQSEDDIDDTEDDVRWQGGLRADGTLAAHWIIVSALRQSLEDELSEAEAHQQAVQDTLDAAAQRVKRDMSWWEVQKAQ